MKGLFVNSFLQALMFVQCKIPQMDIIEKTSKRIITIKYGYR